MTHDQDQDQDQELYLRRVTDALDQGAVLITDCVMPGERGAARYSALVPGSRPEDRDWTLYWDTASGWHLHHHDEDWPTQVPEPADGDLCLPGGARPSPGSVTAGVRAVVHGDADDCFAVTDDPVRVCALPLNCHEIDSASGRTIHAGSCNPAGWAENPGSAVTGDDCPVSAKLLAFASACQQAREAHERRASKAAPVFSRTRPRRLPARPGNTRYGPGRG